MSTIDSSPAASKSRSTEVSLLRRCSTEPWQSQRVLVIEADDEGLTWPERELVRQLGERLYGKAQRQERRHD